MVAHHHLSSHVVSMRGVVGVLATYKHGVFL
jgi:hypothetical protein